MNKAISVCAVVLLALIIVISAIYSIPEDAWMGYKYDYNFVVNDKPVDAAAVIISGHVYIGMADISQIFDIDISILRPRGFGDTHHTVVVNGANRAAQVATIYGSNFVRMIDIAEYLKLDVTVDDEAETVYLQHV